MSVLLVDDNAVSRELLQRQVKDWSMEVSAVANGAEALRLARERVAAGRAFDLALIDLRMPGMNGTSLASALRSDPALAGIKTILLTTVADLMSRAELAQTGVDFAVTKPVALARLREALLAASGYDRPMVEKTAAGADSRLELGVTVLVAEDNLVSQSVLLLQLRKLGCHCRVVENGRLAVEAVQGGGYDLVLMDCEMPEVDGFEATKRIRQWEKSRRAAGEKVTPLPIIALTANAMLGDREACLAAGMTDYLSKPAGVSELAAALARTQVERAT